MKILIITFTGGLNPGTAMQALGVQTGLHLIYPTAQIDFLSFRDFKKIEILNMRIEKKIMVHTIIQKGYAFYRLQKYKKFRKKNFSYTKTVDLFNYAEEDIAFIKDYDLVAIGSDTILERGYSEKGRIGLNWMPLDVNKIYFAASASPANFEPKEDLKNVASRAKFIGLRDDLTINFFIQKLGINESRLIKQPDPSFFLDINKFKLSSSLAKKFKDGNKYALYNFNSNFPLRKELAEGLRSVGYKVVTTSYNPFADICLDTIDAFEWAGVFPLIDIVVTERFHDSVFGLRNEKPVIAIDWDTNRFSASGDSKTLRILEDYGHSHLHFNLCMDTDLKPIIVAVENIDKLFNRKNVVIANQRNENLVNQILLQIKEILQ